MRYGSGRYDRPGPGSIESRTAATGSVSSQSRGAFRFLDIPGNKTPLPTTLGGASLKVGGYPAPILYVGSGQINFQVPYEVLGNSSVVVTAGGVSSVAALSRWPTQRLGFCLRQ